MGRYIVRRIAQSILVLIGVTFISFGVMFLTGDPTLLLLGDTRGMSIEAIEEFRHNMGFDRPWLIQYGDFLWNAVRGDLGKSFYHGRPNMDLILETMPATIELALSAFVITVVVALPIGILSATKRNSLLDRASMSLALLAQSVPVFWLGLILIMIFGVKLMWFPISGRGTIRHLVLPAIALGAFSTARNARMIRSCLLEVLNDDYIRTARSKGVEEKIVIYKHALKNAMIPVITLLGMQFGFLLGGAVITETIFAWPGIGRLTVQAINTKDIPLVQASVITLASIFVVINLLIDLTYTLLDPRVRLR